MRAQDERLRQAVKEYHERDWKGIAAKVGSRDHVQCRHRWRNVLRPGLRKGTWSKAEDDELRSELKRRLSGGSGECSLRTSEPFWYCFLFSTLSTLPPLLKETLFIFISLSLSFFFPLILSGLRSTLKSSTSAYTKPLSFLASTKGPT